MKEKLLQARFEIRKRYGSYLATQVFEKERLLISRINYVLLYRYKTL